MFGAICDLPSKPSSNCIASKDSNVSVGIVDRQLREVELPYMLQRGTDRLSPLNGANFHFWKYRRGFWQGLNFITESPDLFNDLRNWLRDRIGSAKTIVINHIA
jgi:hypothetical protein